MNGLAGVALAGLLATIAIPLAGLALVPAIRRGRRRRHEQKAGGHGAAASVLKANDVLDRRARAEVEAGRRTYLRATGGEA